MLKAINPATGKVIREVEEHDWPKIEEALNTAREAFKVWRETTFEERSKLVRNVAHLLRERVEAYGALITEEMGKTIGQARAEVEKCAWVCEYYAENAQRHLSPQVIPTDARTSYVRFDPLGPILAVMPWNFPFWQVFRFAAPALMAGNVCLLKHASNVPGCAMAIEEVFRDAGFLKGCFSTLLISSAIVEKVIRHPTIQAVTLTGSEPAGAFIAKVAGSEIKKTVLELGGSDPFIVLADADVQRALSTAISARIISNGQSCIAAKRFIIEEPIYEYFKTEMAKGMASLKVGDPMDPQTQVGPLARLDLLEDLDRQVRRSVEMGAILLTGGHRLEGPGFFYAPTVLAEVEPGMPVFDQETFGPVAAIIRAKDERHAIELANHSHFGLGAAIFTGNIDRGQEIARYIEAGNVFINGFVRSDPRLPFGGVKRSGYGRELGEFGIREFVNIKTVWVA